MGEPIEVVIKSGGQPIYWTKLVPVDSLSKELVSETKEAGMLVKTERWVGKQRGEGSLKIDFLLYGLMGIDLSNANKAHSRHFGYRSGCCSHLRFYSS